MRYTPEDIATFLKETKIFVAMVNQEGRRITQTVEHLEEMEGFVRKYSTLDNVDFLHAKPNVEKVEATVRQLTENIQTLQEHAQRTLKYQSLVETDYKRHESHIKKALDLLIESFDEQVK